MLKTYLKKADELSPKVILDKENKIFMISGKSIVENAHKFYNPIIEWFKKYFEEPNENTYVVLKLEYLNSSSAIQIANLFFLFAKNKKKTNIEITWYYEKDDDAMQETGEEYQHSYSLKIEVKELIQYDFE